MHDFSFVSRSITGNDVLPRLAFSSHVRYYRNSTSGCEFVVEPLRHNGSRAVPADQPCVGAEDEDRERERAVFPQAPFCGVVHQLLPDDPPDLGVHLEAKGGAVSVEDLGSQNGSCVSTSLNSKFSSSLLNCVNLMEVKSPKRRLNIPPGTRLAHHFLVFISGTNQCPLRRCFISKTRGLSIPT